MSQLPPSVTIQIKDGGLSQGAVAPPDGVFWIVGMSSSGTPNVPFGTSSASDLISTFGHGDGIEAALFALNNEVNAINFLKVDPTDATPGSYGAITKVFAGLEFGVTGDGVVLPADDTNPRIEFLTGGSLGIAGITYRYSLDGGNKFSGSRALGTDLSITLPLGAGKYNLTGLELSTLIARLAELRTDFIGHTGESGAYHTAVDPSAPYTVATPIDDATILTCCANLRTHALTHVATVGGVHGVIDAAAQTAITSLTVPTTRSQAIDFAEAFKTAFFGTGTANSGHSIRITTAIHAAADIVNVPTSAAAVHNDINAGDAFTLETVAPRWHIDQLVTALDVIKNAPPSASVNGVVEIVGRVLTNGEAEAIEGAAVGIASKYKDVAFVGHYRMRNTGESLQAYASAFEAAHPLASSSGRLGYLTMCASMYLPSQLNAGATLPRPASFAFAPRLARVAISVDPVSFNDFGTIRGALRASNGIDVLPRAVDESFAGVCTPVRLWAPQSRPSGIQPSVAVTISPDGSDYQSIERVRVMAANRKTAYRILDLRLGNKVAPKPGTVIIDPNEAAAIQMKTTTELRDIYQKRKDVIDVYLLVNLNSVVSGNGTKELLTTIFVVPYGSIKAIKATISFALA